MEILIFTISFLIDRITKILASTYLMEDFFRLSDVVRFHYQLNTGFIAWQIPREILLCVGVCMLVFFILLFRRTQRVSSTSSFGYASALFLAGALSNMIDRAAYGGVIDWIEIPGFTFFNLSDVCIAAGIVWILFSILFKRSPVSHTSV